MSAIFSWGIHIWNFKTVAFTVLKLCYASKSVTNGRTDGRKDRRTDGRTNNPEAICPSNFFEVGGIKKETNIELKVGWKVVTNWFALLRHFLQSKDCYFSNFSIKTYIMLCLLTINALSRCFLWISIVRLFVLRFYGPVNPMGSCWVWSVYLTTRLLGRLLFVLRFYGPVNPMGSCRVGSVYLPTRLLGRLSPLSG